MMTANISSKLYREGWRGIRKEGARGGERESRRLAQVTLSARWPHRPIFNSLAATSICASLRLPTKTPKVVLGAEVSGLFCENYYRCDHVIDAIYTTGRLVCPSPTNPIGDLSSLNVRQVNGFLEAKVNGIWGAVCQSGFE